MLWIVTLAGVWLLCFVVVCAAWFGWKAVWFVVRLPWLGVLALRKYQQRKSDADLARMQQAERGS